MRTTLPAASWLELSRTVVHRVCTTAGCRRNGTDTWPSLRTCPGCGPPLARRELP